MKAKLVSEAIIKHLSPKTGKDIDLYLNRQKDIIEKIKELSAIYKKKPKILKDGNWSCAMSWLAGFDYKINDSSKTFYFIGIDAEDLLNVGWYSKEDMLADSFEVDTVEEAGKTLIEWINDLEEDEL